MTSVINQISKLAAVHNVPDPKLIRKHNIKLGLRNADGSGVVVGLTSKGCVIGYEKALKSNPLFDREDITIQIPGLDGDLSPAEACYVLLNGHRPTHSSLEAFLSHMSDYSQYDIRPTEGRLYYCGYSVKDLVNACKDSEEEGFNETIYLLLTGELPKASQLQKFHDEMTHRRSIPMRVTRFITYASENPDQMSALHRAVAAMSLVDKNPNTYSMSHQIDQCLDLIAKFPAIIAHNYNAMLFRKGKGHGFINSDPHLSPMENFMHMLNGQKPERFAAKLLDILMVLHAEHGGGNNSTFTVRSVTSSGANTYMAISSGIASLSGYLHGGAAEAVVDMMADIQKNVRDWNDDDELSSYLKRILAGEAYDLKGKIYGIGHAVYTLSDPRAVILLEKAEELAKTTGQEHVLSLYRNVARLACQLVQEEKGKRVSPNVDFYSGFIYQMIGIPKELFTPLFAMARVSGWCAHRLEQITQGRIIRPAYVASIEPRKYIAINKRRG
ncbi:MAG: citrate synthase [Candidatus Omnitrophica bacterium]|nr:citrate synthase [Candidatus Omnitrophota bacterium]